MTELWVGKKKAAIKDVSVHVGEMDMLLDDTRELLFSQM